MKQRQDSDIFGTKNLPIGVRIENNSYINPNEVFEKRMNEQFEAYTEKLQNRKFRMKQKTQLVKVMDEAYFDQDYHRNRKGLDLQSSIFSPNNITNYKHFQSKPQLQNVIKQPQIQKHFGKRQTLSRQINNLPENAQMAKGNTSRLFGFDERIEKVQNKSLITPLIPHQMKWNEYDSVRYQGNKPLNQHHQIPLENLIIKSEAATVQNPECKMQKAVTKEKKINPVQNELKSNQVEIKILNGWNNNYLQGLAKQCKIYSTKLLKFQFDGGKGLIVIQKSKKWENICEWIRKQAKTKIRIINN